MPKSLTPRDQWETEFEVPIPGEPRNIGPLEALFQRLLNRTERLRSRIGAIIGGPWDSTPPDTLTGLDARVNAHRTTSPIDHPDGSVTLAKLDPTILGRPHGVPLLDALGAFASAEAYLARQPIVTEVNWNDIINAGVYDVYSEAFGGTNAPPARYPYGHLVVFRSERVFTQIYIPHTNDPGIYWRQAWNNDWRAWSSAGTQYGSNANGSYIRFANGTQICWHRGLIGPSPQTWVFPAAFTSIPTVVGFAVERPFIVFTSIDYQSSQTQYVIAKYNQDGTEYEGPLGGLNLIAIGRWF